MTPFFPQEYAMLLCRRSCFHFSAHQCRWDNGRFPHTTTRIDPALGQPQSQPSVAPSPEPIVDDDDQGSLVETLDDVARRYAFLLQGNKHLTLLEWFHITHVIVQPRHHHVLLILIIIIIQPFSRLGKYTRESEGKHAKVIAS